jgi:3-hydroxyacyl-CoA dehydrogenase/enoyl-CoA hydratase/3-hydroxybutyryl-CoA epimerase
MGEKTSDEALAMAFDYVVKIKKTPIVVNDSRGFFTSRVFGTFAMEGVAMLAEGFAANSIEQAALQVGMPVGPLAVNDEVSLELGRHVRVEAKKALEAQGKTYVGSAADPIIDRMCEEFNRKGRAAGAGFYEYPAGGKKHLWPGLKQHFQRADGGVPTPEQFQDLKDRFLYMQSIETIRCLEENVLRSVADANIGSIMGIGAPPWTGGLLQFVNYVGVPEFLRRAEELTAKYGERFAPPKLLREMAASGKTFSK